MGQTSQNPRREPPESRLFEHIEATIAGAVEFVGRYLVTTGTLAIRPRRVFAAIAAGDFSRFNWPFSYLAISVLVAGMFLRAITSLVLITPQEVQKWADQGAVPPDDPAIEGLLAELRNVAQPNFLEQIIPALVSIIVLGTFTSMLMKDRDRYLLRGICYVGGYVSALAAIFSAFILIQVQLGYDFSVEFIGMLVLVIIGSAGITLYMLMHHSSDSPEQLAGLGTVPAAVTSVILAGLIFGAELASTVLPFSFSMQAELARPIVKTNIHPLRAIRTPEYTFRVQLLIGNQTAKPIFLSRIGPRLYGQVEFAGRPLPVPLPEDTRLRDWESGSAPVMRLDPGAYRWLEIETTASEALAAAWHEPIRRASFLFDMYFVRTDPWGFSAMGEVPGEGSREHQVYSNVVVFRFDDIE